MLCYNCNRLELFSLKKIYIVLTYTGSMLSRFIKFYTKNAYSHVSISLDGNLDSMYSFGRFHAYNPFWGGFVQESTKFGTFKRFKKAKTKIYSLEVSNEDYDIIKGIIEDFYSKRDVYRFNMIGLIGVMLNRRVKRENHYYCAEFVKYCFDNTSLEIDMPDIVKVEDFEKIKGTKEIYTGYLNEYKM